MSDAAKPGAKPAAKSSAKPAAKGPGDKKVVVRKWNAVAFWAYDHDNDTCAICHNALMIPCTSLVQFKAS